MFSIYLLFIFSGFLVILAGSKLSKYGDVIASKSVLGHGIVGGVLIAAATSLPELTTSITSALIDAPDIAIGNVYGSNTFNLMILAVGDIFHRHGRFLGSVKLNHILAGMFGVLLSAIGAMSILMNRLGGFDLKFGWISIYSIVIFVTYIFGSILIIRYESKLKRVEPEEVEEIVDSNSITLRRAVIGFGVASAIIIWAGINLSYTGEAIAKHTGLGQTFVGTLLVAATTSLPELVATITAINIGAYDMAAGSVFGSNVFNMLIITVTDIAYYKGSIYSVVDINHTITAMAGIVLSSIAVIGLFYRSKRTVFTIGWDSVFIIGVYIFTVYYIYIS